MEEKIEIMNLLQSKQVLEHELQSLAYGAVEIRENDSNMEEIISHIKDEMTEIQVAAERGFLRGVNGSCHIPMGAYCEIKDNKLHLSGLYGDEEGNKLVIKSITGDIEEAEEIGFELAKNVLKEYNSL